MKAMLFEKYGPPEGLQLKEIEKPAPKNDEVLIKVHATSVNDWDWGLLRGTPFVNRLMFGLLKPRTGILGCDIAGIVEAIGENATQFQPGDQVFGDISACGFGGFAEYVCARESAFVPKPDSITFEQAAAIPQASILALQGLRKKERIGPGQRLLINGAGGGAGTFAIQIARHFGAEVTGVDSTEKLNSMRSIGATHVIDYTQEDFTKNGQHYDMILDFAAHHSVFDYKRSLSPNGIYVMAGGSTARILQVFLLGPWISRVGNKKLAILGHKANTGLDFIKELVEAGKVTPIIDKRYALSEAPDALRYFGEGHARGKVVITVELNG